MKIAIKNMVCSRCVMVVASELERLGLNPFSVTLGEIILVKEPAPAELELLNSRLKSFGFELLDSRKSIISEKVKNLIVDLVHQKNNDLKKNLSSYIAQELGHDYSYISSIFTEQNGTTIEQYYILQKIEKVKELLVYDQFTLSEIADMLNYSSASHLSKQFKKVTGLTVSYFKNLRREKRIPIEDL